MRSHVTCARDNGQVYRSQQLSRIVASLGILIVHTPPYQPEGRGKIERFYAHLSIRHTCKASLRVCSATAAMTSTSLLFQPFDIRPPFTCSRPGSILR
ncbi:MAG: hypothetical protein DMG17_20265 [Acidobacteria bacterium]|nr:MAG: hypothetical protein DMG17_20265 [Acidobacteriota bacterium]